MTAVVASWPPFVGNAPDPDATEPCRVWFDGCPDGPCGCFADGDPDRCAWDDGCVVVGCTDPVCGPVAWPVDVVAFDALDGFNFETEPAPGLPGDPDGWNAFRDAWCDALDVWNGHADDDGPDDDGPFVTDTTAVVDALDAWQRGADVVWLSAWQRDALRDAFGVTGRDTWDDDDAYGPTGGWPALADGSAVTVDDGADVVASFG